METREKEYRKLIFEKCCDCSGGIKAEVLRCQIPDCPLFPVRLDYPELELKELVGGSHFGGRKGEKS